MARNKEILSSFVNNRNWRKIMMEGLKEVEGRESVRRVSKSNLFKVPKYRVSPLSSSCSSVK